MTLDATVPLRRPGRGELVALQLAVGLFLVLRVYFDLTADPLGDEAYYWLWGQKLGWSYFDHPPLHAWLLRVVDLALGWQLMSVRVLTWLTLGGVLLIFRNWARRFAPEDSALWFWRSAAIYLASPLFFGMTLISYNDHLLVFLSLVAIHCFVVFAERVELERPGAIRWLYAAAVALGLAVLSKYNGLFVGLGFAAAFVLRPSLRPLLRTPHPWLAALIAIAMQAPVVYWNVTEHLASFRYHLDDRWKGEAGQLNLLHPLQFIALVALVWSPFLIWPTIRLFRAPGQSVFETNARWLTGAVFAISTGLLLLISPLLDAFFYWNILAFIGLAPQLPRVLGNQLLLWCHIGFGALMAGLIVCNFAVFPVAAMVGMIDHGTPVNFGWQEIADHVRAAEAKSPTDLVGATRYSTTSQLGFALGIKDAVRLSGEHSQYDYWQESALLEGKSALILADEGNRSAAVRWLNDHFTTIEPVDEFSIVRFGRQIYHWRIFRGDGLRAAAP